VRTYPLASRTSKGAREDFAKPFERGASFRSWFDSLPAILGARDLHRVVQAIVHARAAGAGIVWGIGAHVIKTGVSPVLIDLIHRGYVSALAMNGQA
jgi:deoxyhypusine synthase